MSAPTESIGSPRMSPWISIPAVVAVCALGASEVGSVAIIASCCIASWFLGWLS